MNMQFKFKFFGILIILALLLGNMPTSVVHSQMGGGYDCGQWTFVDQSGRLGGWWFNHWPFDGQRPSWIMRNVPPEWDLEMNGAYTRIWHPTLDESYSLGPIVLDIGSYEVVPNCDPILDFWSDNEAIIAGECTQLHWNIDIAGLDAVYLDGQVINPSGDTTVCPTSDTTYTLQASTYGYGDYSPTLTINVFYPTDTPEPTSTRVPPTNTRIPPSSTAIPPTQKPISTLIVPPPATQNSTLELSVVPINQHLSPAITLSNGLKDYGEYDCFIASMSMALEYFRNQNILNENDTTNYRSLVPIVRGTTPPSIGIVGDPAFVSTVTNNKLSASVSYTTPENLSNAIETELKAGRPIVTSVPNWNLLAGRWAGRVAHSIFVYGLYNERLYYVDPWDGNRYDMPIQDFVNANTWPDGSFLITFTSLQQ